MVAQEPPVIGRAVVERAVLDQFGGRTVGVVLGLVILAVVTWITYVSYGTDPAVLKQQVGHYLHRTDVRGLLGIMSKPVAALGLLGILAMCVLPGERMVERRVFLVTTLPAALLLGNMYDFFMTRYMLVVLIPLLTISLCGLATLVPTLRRSGKCIFIALLLLMCGLVIRNRTILIRHTNYAGFARYIGKMAAELKEE